MKTGLDLVMEAVDAWTEGCRKYNGALAVELLKQAFAEEGIATSGRDSYVRSLHIEWDLLVLRAGAKPAFNLLYDAIDITMRKFEVARAAGVKCCYVSFCGRRNGAATTEKVGFPCFNLTWYHGEKKPREDTGQWPMLVDFMRG